MKKIIPLALLALSVMLFSCSNKKEIEELQTQLKQITAESNQLKAQKELLENNKKIVTSFYQEFFGDKDLSAADRYVADEYIQHNPTSKDGKKALVESAKVWKNLPKEKINFLNIAAENDLVFVQVGSIDSTGNKHMFIDVFRVTNGKLTEHWDAFALFRKGDQSANDHPLF